LTQVIRRKPSVFDDAVPQEDPILLQQPSLGLPMVPRSHGQSSSSVVMMAPTAFYQSLETMADNYFMQLVPGLTKQQIQAAALKEFGNLYHELIRRGVCVELFTHEAYHETPDAVFPNNW
jgi:hypothetical protein